MRAPNLYIVGAPKSGSTSLFRGLAAHPDVFEPRTKELNHLGADLKFRKRRSEDSYAAAFDEWAGERYALDGTVFLLLSQSAAGEIHERRPDARIIAVLRDPFDAIPSLHAQLLQSGDEDEPDLRRALALAPLRAAGERTPPRADHPHALQYLDVVDYEPQVRRYLDVFGSDQVHIELFDDLRADPRSVMARCLAFLDLPDDGTNGIAHLNTAKRVRSATVRDLVRQPPSPARRAARFVLRTPRARSVVRRAARNAVNRYNRVSIVVPPPDPLLLEELIAALTPGIDALEELLGRDLSAWRRG